MSVILYKEVKGDLFKVDRTRWCLAHCISEDVTATKNMNKGIAKLFRSEHPKMAAQIAPFLRVGKAIRYSEENQTIYNLISKRLVWQKAKGDYKPRYYQQLSDALNDMKDQMVSNNELYLAMPRIASGLDGGNWEEIRRMIKNTFKNTMVEIQIRYL
ncbi:MAG: hypothetical protein ACFFAO_18265 [Candidatus Hermodarchaeota archaeon]